MNISAPLTDEDRILIRILRAENGYNAHQMMIEFSSRKLNNYALYRLIKQIDVRERLTTATVIANVLRASFTSYGGLSERLRARVNWTRELNMEQSRFKPGWLFDLHHWTGYHDDEPIRDVEHLKEVILCCLVEITQALVDSAIDQSLWSSGVDAVIKARGGHNEYLLGWWAIHSRY